MLALLDRLKNTVRDFVAREGKITSEFRVQTANFDAAYGRGTGANVVSGAAGWVVDENGLGP